MSAGEVGKVKENTLLAYQCVHVHSRTHTGSQGWSETRMQHSPHTGEA